MESLEICLDHCLKQFHTEVHTIQEGFDLIINALAPFICDGDSDIYSNEGGELLISVTGFYSFLTM